jgi:hypothetical protein
MDYKKFSEREGFVKIRDVIQIESMDEGLHNSFWNILLHLYRKYQSSFIEIFTNMWINLFKEPIDAISTNSSKRLALLRQYFFTADWYIVYDIIEFYANNISGTYQSVFIDDCNYVLNRELSGWKFVGTYISRITEEQEITEIEEALTLEKPFKPVSNHVNKALKLFSDKGSSNYANVIKESISAVEAMCKIIMKDKNAKLGQVLKILQDRINLHPALSKAYDNIFGYTSDADGIRHASLEESNLDFEDAKFMLVSCSAFVNYLKVKMLKVGIGIS